MEPITLGPVTLLNFTIGNALYLALLITVGLAIVSVPFFMLTQTFFSWPGKDEEPRNSFEAYDDYYEESKSQVEEKQETGFCYYCGQPADPELAYCSHCGGSLRRK